MSTATTTAPATREPIALDLTNLPNDPAFLKQLVADLVGALKDKDTCIGRLREQLRQTLHRQFGRRSETVHPAQMELFLQQIAASLAKVEEPSAAPAEATPKRKGHGRRKTPKDLPKQRTIFPLPEEKKTCDECHGPLTKIAEDVRTLIDYVPAMFVLKEDVREIWACEPCEGNVVMSDLPPKPVEKGMAGAGLLAHVVTNKYVDHLPLYRQESILAREGLSVTRSTLCGWVAQVADLLKPLYDTMTADLEKSKVLHADDTSVPVLDERAEADSPAEAAAKAEAAADAGMAGRKTREGSLWVRVGDKQHPHIIFNFMPTRGRDEPRAMFEGWKGKLQVDAHPLYDRLFESEGLLEAACWAHARRYFVDADFTDRTRARTAVAYIHQLYRVEAAAKDLDDPKKLALRQQLARPILDTFKSWLDAQMLAVLPQSPMAKATGYALRNWTALTRYVDDPCLDIDNNVSERALRCVAVGRKNWLFCGSDEGGRRAAILYSLVATCKEHRIDPWAYLRAVLARIPTHPDRRRAELLPRNWTATPAAAQP